MASNNDGYQQLTVSTAAVSLTRPTGKRSRRALIYVGTSAIRWRADGVAPTSTTGLFVAAGAYIDWTSRGEESDYSGLIDKAQFIRDTTASGDATLDILYFSGF